MRYMVLVASLLCSCAASDEWKAKSAEFEATVPTCRSDRDCSAKWDAAQLWVAKNAGFKIQIASQVVISTFNSTNGSPSIAVQVTKEPAGNGRFKIVANAWCDNVFGCNPARLDAMLDFNKFVNEARP